MSSKVTPAKPALHQIELTPTAQEAERLMVICNACRYCEGYCAVFPAMTRRLEFPAADIRYLANLCHHCGACLHACQYAPPHEFALNLPRAMASVRGHSHARNAWPAALGRLYERNGAMLAVVGSGAFALLVALVLGTRGRLWGAIAAGDFYAILPHRLLVGLFAPVFAFAVIALAVGVGRFWRGGPGGPLGAAAAAEAARDALRLKYLDGGHGRREARQEPVEGQVVEAPAHRRERVVALVAALAVAAVQVLEPQRVARGLGERRPA